MQVYLHDPVAQATRPVVRLIGFARVELAPGEQRRVSLTFAADLTAFTGVEGKKVVEPGDLELRIGPRAETSARLLRCTSPGRSGKWTERAP